MWFKNLQVYRLPAHWDVSADQIASWLAAQAFAPCSSIEAQSSGWVSPNGTDQLVYHANRQFLLQLNTERKLLPSSVINQVAKARAAEMAEQQGFPPGRRQMKELKEQVLDELLPRAFSIVRSTRAWIDPVNGWLIIDAASPARAEEVIKLLLQGIPKFPMESWRTKLSAQTAMTGWLAEDDAPVNFTIDQDTELRAPGESKATVRFVRHTPEPDDVRRHIASGKQCVKLAMTWNDKISFVLQDNGTVKRLAPLDVLQEQADVTAQNDDERFNADFVLMAGEVAQLLTDLTNALGGIVSENDGTGNAIAASAAAA